MGIDAVSWKVELLTACVFDERAFWAIFSRGTVSKRDSEYDGDKILEAAPFDEKNVNAYSDSRRVLAAGSAYLVLGFRHRTQLLNIANH